VVKKILIPVGIVVVCVLIAMVMWVGYMASPTKGKTIEIYDTPQKALLVIDLQEDCTGKTAKSPFPYENSEEMIENVNRLVKESMKRDILVVFIDQEFSGFTGTLWSRLFVGGRLIKGQPGTEIDKRIITGSASLFSKPKGDAFSNSDFEEFLVRNHVDELYLTGVDAEYCVYQTAKGALNRGYKVAIVRDAVGLLNTAKWHDILEKYMADGIHVIDSTKHVFEPATYDVELQ
jgi:nicotinamidase/pyrazinamidase